jgi:drug/metabolite transporter (DMT)-like permease
VKPHTHVPLSSIVMIIASALCFSSLDSIVKYLSPHYPVPLLVWARWTVQVIALLVCWGPAMGTGLVRSKQWTTQLLRGLALIASSVLFATALKHLPLAEVTALNYSTPLMVALLASVVLHERLTRSQIAFVFVGIVGMLLIVRPGSEVFQPIALLALCSAMAYSIFTILTRTVIDDDPRVSLFFPALVSAVVMTLVLPTIEWPAVIHPADVALLVAGSLVGTCGHFLFILAFRHGPVASLAPFSYFQIVFATLIGWFVFGAFPPALALAGMAIITGSGLLITLQARRRERALGAFPAPDPTAVD